jgi:small subunit ribosomal protein S2
VIPGNDDAIRSGSLMCRIVADAVDEGRLMRSKRHGGNAGGPAAPVAVPKRTSEQEAAIAAQQAEARRQAALAAKEREARIAAGAPPAAPAEGADAAPDAAATTEPATAVAPDAAAPSQEESS